MRLNRNFAKATLKADGTPDYAPNAFHFNGRDYLHPTAEDYHAAGFIDVLNNPAPSDAPQGQHYEFRSYEVADGAIRRTYALVDDPPPPPRVFVTADLVEALMAEGIYQQVRDWIVEQGMLDLVLATKEFDENNANFQAGKTALQSALGWTDAEVEELLAKCVKEGV